MELKDVILSTLAEMEDVSKVKEVPKAQVEKEKEIVEKLVEKREVKKELPESKLDSEILYLSSMRERLLVLFEGFQSPNNTNIEAKVDMTLNFLEYVLATIDVRMETLEKGKK